MRSFVLSVFLLLSACSGSGSSPAATPAAVCAHGVLRDICARCDPRLEPAFRAQNDWCEEHARPETQCVLCNPELAARGVK